MSHCLPRSFGKNLFQISAKPKYTAQTDELYLVVKVLIMIF